MAFIKKRFSVSLQILDSLSVWFCYLWIISILLRSIYILSIYKVNASYILSDFSQRCRSFFPSSDSCRFSYFQFSCSLYRHIYNTLMSLSLIPCRRNYINGFWDNKKKDQEWQLWILLLICRFLSLPLVNGSCSVSWFYRVVM